MCRAERKQGTVYGSLPVTVVSYIRPATLLARSSCTRLIVCDMRPFHPPRQKNGCIEASRSIGHSAFLASSTVTAVPRDSGIEERGPVVAALAGLARVVNVVGLELAEHRYDGLAAGRAQQSVRWAIDDAAERARRLDAEPSRDARRVEGVLANEREGLIGVNVVEADRTWFACHATTTVHRVRRSSGGADRHAGPSGRRRTMRQPAGMRSAAAALRSARAARARKSHDVRFKK